MSLVVAVAALAGCNGSQVARSRITPGRTSVQRDAAPPTTFSLTIRPIGDGGRSDPTHPTIIIRPAPQPAPVPAGGLR